MHESVIIRKIDAINELFDIARKAVSEGNQEMAFKYTGRRVTNLIMLLKPYLDNPDDMLHSLKVKTIFESFFTLKEKFDAFLKDHFQKSREWYTAALIVSEADGSLDENTLASHTVRECLKKGMRPWVSACVTNSVLEKDLVPLAEANSAHEALLKSGKIK
ncbi:hypothetical protein [Marinobacter salarius]|uniref:hypothetical protein n=1 Tax=Marinobacter salarius TaxID=1420917 RepID=UPI003BA9750E